MPLNSPNILRCGHKYECNACQNTETEYPSQLKTKQELLAEKCLTYMAANSHADIEVLSVGPYHFRNKMDLVWSQDRLGFYSQKSGRDFSIIDLKQCELITEDLQNWFNSFKQIHWPIQKGSVRLRSGKNKLRGAWLDFANLDVAQLLKQETLLKGLLDSSNPTFIEIGQRRKKLVSEDRLKLTDPEFHSWSSSRCNDQEVDLYSCVGTFTQSGNEAQHKLAYWIDEKLSALNIKSVIEFGSGVGTLTFPASSQGRKVLACEVDKLATEALQFSRRKFEDSNDLQLNIDILNQDFQNKSYSFDSHFDCFLINPPRSGMMNFNKTLAALPKNPQYGIYVSCFLDSFLKDCEKLKEMNYRISELAILDQFPWTDHFEILAVFKKGL